MTDQHPDEPDQKPAKGTRPRTPLWVKVFGLIALVGLVAIVILHLTGNGMIGH